MTPTDWLKLPLPESLTNARLWTLSSPDKVPLDPVSYGFNKPYGWSPTKGSRLRTFSEVIQVLFEYPDRGYLPALRVQNTSGYLVVDIEPEALPDTYYESLPYIYLEWSKNKGLHGILPYRGDSKRLKQTTVIVDRDHQTEFMLHNHFITFTGNQIPLDQLDERKALASRSDFQDRLAGFLEGFLPEDAPRPEEVTSPLDERPLSPVERDWVSFLVGTSLPLKDEGNTSDSEFRKYVELAFSLVYKAPDLPREDVRRLVYHAAKRLVPYRKKHAKELRSADYGTIPYQTRDIVKAVDYVWTQTIDLRSDSKGV